MNWTFWRRARPAPARRNHAERDPPDPDELPGPDDAALALRQRARRRLIGAAVLLLAIAIVLPMLLDQAPRPLADNVRIDIPSEKTPFTPRLALPPVDVGPAAGDAGPVAEEPKGDAGKSGVADPPKKPAEKPAAGKPKAELSNGDAGKSRAADPPKKPAEKPAEKPAAAKPKAELPNVKAETKKTAPDLTKTGARDPQPSSLVAAKNGVADGRFLLQAGAFSNEAAAQSFSERLRSAGLQPFIERVETKSGARFRVRVGPYPSRDEAQRAQLRLRSLGVTATLVPAKAT